MQPNWKACKSITYWSGIIRSCLITFPYSGAVKLQQPSPEPCHVLIIPIIIKMTSQLFMATSPLLEIFSKSVKTSFIWECWVLGRDNIIGIIFYFICILLSSCLKLLEEWKEKFRGLLLATYHGVFFYTHTSWLIYLAHTMQKFLALLRDH